MPSTATQPRPITGTAHFDHATPTRTKYSAEGDELIATVYIPNSLATGESATIEVLPPGTSAAGASIVTDVLWEKATARFTKFRTARGGAVIAIVYIPKGHPFATAKSLPLVIKVQGA